MATISREFKRTRATRVVDGEPKTRFVYTRDQNGNKVASAWRVRWRDHEGKQHSQRFERRNEAQRFANEVETEMARGTYIDPAAGKTTFADYVDTWLPAQVWRPTTREAADSHLKNHLLPALGSKPMAQITRTDCQSLVKRLDDKGLAPATTEAIYRRLVSILQAAVHDRVIAQTPAVKIQLPKKDRRPTDSVVFLTVEQIHRLAETVPPWLRAFAWVMASSGLRPGEAAGLTLERVNFMRRELIVDRQLLSVTGKLPYLAPPKTAASIRTVPVPDSLLVELNEHLERFAPVEIEPGAHLLFASRTRSPLRRSTMSAAWTAAAAKLDFGKEARGWHVLRHSYASMLIESGLSVRAVQARLGHATATETLNTYAHLWPDTDDDTRAAVERGLSTREGRATGRP